MIINTIKILGISLVDILLLFIIAPIIDHLFKPLDKNKTNIHILLEIISQLISVSFIWYILDKFIFNKLKIKLNIIHKPLMQKSYNIITSIILIGLQSHLVTKLNYITHVRPFNIFNYFKKIYDKEF